MKTALVVKLINSRTQTQKSLSSTSFSSGLSTFVQLSPTPVSSLFPFLYFMIRDFHIVQTEEDIGYYAGYIGSSFMLGRALTSVLWGIIADWYGRKPVIIFGTFAVVLNTLFGISSDIWRRDFCWGVCVVCSVPLGHTLQRFAGKSTKLWECPL